MKIDNQFSVVLFIPETGIYPYMRTLAILGDAAKQRGNKAFLTHCTGQMPRCPMKAMHRTDLLSQGKHLCKICSEKFEIVKSRYGFSSIELANLISDSKLLELDNLFNLPEEEWQYLVYKGIPIGKLAQYDFSLQTKSNVYENLSNEHKELYKGFIKNTAVAIELTEQICLNYNPGIFLTFNPYAQCLGVKAAASAYKINFLYVSNALHNNADYSRFEFQELLSGCFPHYMKWKDYKKYSINPKYVIECVSDSLMHFYQKGSHIFSKPKKGNIEKVFLDLGLNPKRKTIIAYTSSNDERKGFEELIEILKEGWAFSDVFPSQIAWIQWLRDYAGKRNDIQLIVRIHPREGTRKFNFGSKHLDELKEAFHENTSNFKIVWPDDPISSYDLLELAELCLVPWTTMGQEAAKLGIPVLSYTSNMYYPDDDFIQVATSLDDYGSKLDSMTYMQYTWQHLVKAVRYYHWRTFITSLELGETIPCDYIDETIWPSAPESCIDVINDILQFKQNLPEYNIKRWLLNMPQNATELENIALREGIRIILDNLFYPPIFGKRFMFRLKRKVWRILTGRELFLQEKPFKDYSLEYSDEINRINEFIQITKKAAATRIIISDGMYALLVHKGKLIKKMSPMILNLVKLYASQTK